MPTYQYECQACGHSFEELQAMTDAKLKQCPKCRKKKLVRLIGGGSGMIFKGSGFYETDYKRKPSSAKDSPKSESKPSPAPAGPCGGSCACHSH
ncbi:MAG: zinc ribbon domain-containing protein [Candidatus Omnitrophica bacterium]|nr:zinc ribbon domain-containing protein [Candidatus Omnitrophota bacterium]MDE2010187.1 zinc ribbon domain-containing protein [Candidatus Omnitrophota bacterium]MDE2215075.1 zinc ribbon domain-containing protein [Candidatus Omnitrophota bacterium]MDE2232208.1 zinc ribbon domain-containing protein [Candidatus Omnitrophota bacterium]